MTTTNSSEIRKDIRHCERMIAQSVDPAEAEIWENAMADLQNDLDGALNQEAE